MLFFNSCTSWYKKLYSVLVCFFMLVNFSLFGQCPCSGTASYLVGTDHGNPILSTSGLPLGSVTGADIRVCGEFTIDVTAYTFDDCLFEMEPGSSIKIINGAGASIINNSAVQNCGSTFWNGILVEPGGGLFMNDVVIFEGALTGIIVQDQATAWIMSTRFDANNRHISVQGSPSFLVAGNEFLGTFPVPGLGTLPSVAIDASFATCQIGVQNFENEFVGLSTHAIRATGSNLGVRGNQFIGMMLSGSGPSVYSGVAAISGSYLSMRNNVSVGTRNVIYTDNSSSNIRLNEFEYFENAVVSNLFSTDQSYVYQNTFGPGIGTNLSKVGVSCDNFGGDLEVYDNQMNIQAPSGGTLGTYGIFVEGFGANGDVKVVQHDGSGNNGFINVNGDGRVAGIRLENVNNALAISNDIEVVANNGLSDAACIGLLGGEEIIVRENVGRSTGTQIVDGISTVNSPRNIYCCNSVETTRNGFRFIGECDGAQFVQNAIQNSNDGLNLFELAIIGRQDWEGNEWNGSYNGLGAINQNSNPLLISASEFVVNSISPPVHPPSVSPGGGSWFDIRPGGHTVCGQSISCPTSIGSGDGLSPIDEALIDASIDTSIPSGYKWMAEKNLFLKLKNNSELSTSTTEINSWYLSKIGSSLDKLIEFEEGLRTTLVLSEQEDSHLKAIQDSIDQLYVDLHDLDVLIVQSPISGWSNYLNARSTILHELKQYKFEYDDYLSSVKTDIADEIVTLKSELLGISSNLSIENHYLELYKILLDEMLPGEFDLDSGQKSVVETIAPMCVEDEGPSVYLARIMLRTYDSNSDYNDETLCGSSSLLMSSEEEEKEIFRIYPNPSDGIFLLEGLQGEVVYIYDSFGKLILSLESNSAEIDLSSFPDGLYFARAEVERKEIIRKLIKR